jgi:hypothetical protein
MAPVSAHWAAISLFISTEWLGEMETKSLDQLGWLLFATG